MFAALDVNAIGVDSLRSRAGELRVGSGARSRMLPPLLGQRGGARSANRKVLC
jgi:hypothetical protein